MSIYNRNEPEPGERRKAEQTQGTKCPFSIYGRCKGCALFNNGCALVRLAAATYKE